MAETIYLNNEADRNMNNDIMWSQQIQSLNIEELMTFLTQLETMWKINEKNDKYVSFHLGYERFFNKAQLESDGVPKVIDIENVACQQVRMKNRLGELFHKANDLGILNTEDDCEMKISMRINRLIDQVDDAYHIVSRNARIYERINNPTYVPINPESDPSIFRCSTIAGIEELTDFQQAILAILNKLYQTNTKRYKEQCCSQIMTKNGAPTRAWKSINTIEKYIYGMAQKETWFDLWKLLSGKPHTYSSVVQHLTKCIDMQFPEIIKDRHVWSFKNGIFIGKKWSDKSGSWECTFYPYESKEFKNLDQSIVACKYFDKEFENYTEDNWRDIPTPYFDAVLKYQNFEDEVCNWMYVMGGRLCYEVNEMDGWQVIPFLKGIARSGKSTLITKVFRKFYETEDVKTLSNNIEKKFGLSSIAEGLVFIAPEVKNDLALEQAEFQSVVSGEDVSIAVKHEKARSMVWTIPGILGGNEVPNWKDNAGSILRRIVTFNFGKQVKEADPQLDVKLDTELPLILQKCVMAYLEYSQKYANKDVWNVLPEYFLNVRKQVALVASTLENFLQSSKIKIDPNLYCPKETFINEFNSYCLSQNLGKPRFTYDFYIGPFSQRDVVVETKALMKYKGRDMRNKEFVIGLDIVEEENMGMADI